MPHATTFEIIPAIDLRGGRAVRLRQGDFDRETVYSDDPATVAQGFADAGARWLHVVDLDGARTGAPVNGVAIHGIVRAVRDAMRVEVAGGLRTEASVAAVLMGGAARAIVGTAALRDPGLVARLVADHGVERIAVALDVRDGLAIGEGWQTGATGLPVDQAIASLADVGVKTFEVTAIDRDGLLGGPDLALYERLIAPEWGSIIASAGIATLADLRALRDLGCAGAIVGRALLDGSMDLREALAAIAP
jgi:phosphoribosylformimino-5-aminoimidazole carboxamide ribotide isomerase